MDLKYLDIVGGAGGVPFSVSNATNAVDIARFNDNATTVMRILDGGTVYFLADDGGHGVWNPGGCGEFKKVGGDEFWRLSEESYFNSIVDVGSMTIAGNSWGVPFQVSNAAAAVDIARFNDNATTVMRILDGGTVYFLADDGGHGVWNPGGCGEFKKVGGDEFWRLAEESRFSGVVDTGYLDLVGGYGLVPLSVSNATDAVDIARFNDNTTPTMVIADGGKIYLGDPAGKHALWDPNVGAGEFKKVGGDEFWRLSEESYFFSIVDVAYLLIGGGGGYVPLQVSNAATVLDIARFRDNATTVMSIADGGKIYLGDPSGEHALWDPTVGGGEFKKVGGDVFWSLSEESHFNSIIDVAYMTIAGNPWGIPCLNINKGAGSQDILKVRDGGTTHLVVNENGNVGIGTESFGAAAAGVLSIGNGTAPTGGATDASMIYAKDVAVSSEMFVMDEAGNETQISPHDRETGEWIFYSKNVKTGRVVRVNMEKLVKKIEEITGEEFLEEWIEE